MPAKDAVIRDHILSVIGTSRKGRNKVIHLVQRAQPELSSSKIRRVYEQSGMSLYKRPKRRLKGQKSVPLNVPLLPMQELAMDFMSDCLAEGRRFRTLNVIDHHNRKCLGIFVDFSLPSVKVIEALERVFDMYGTPKAIRTDNGPEFTSKRFRLWMHLKGVQHIRIQPGKPAQNGIVERFNRTYREDVLDAQLFESLEHARRISYDWLADYNVFRPHESLGNYTPNTYVA